MSKSTVYKVVSLADLPKVAERFVEDWKANELVAFWGKMGVGKTTFIKAICKVLGVEDIVSSPTFSIVNEYTTAIGTPLYHFDFYRIDDEQEALDFGVEEYWYSGNLCLMEWPEKVDGLLPDGILEVKIDVLGGGVREITVTS